MTRDQWYDKMKDAEIRLSDAVDASKAATDRLHNAQAYLRALGPTWEAWQVENEAAQLRKSERERVKREGFGGATDTGDKVTQCVHQPDAR